MASKVTADNIIDFNKKYYLCHNYSQVARETGFSASTVRKYIDKNWKPIDETKRKIFDPKNLSDDFDTSIFIGIENFGDLCSLSKEEEEEIKELWEELDI